MKGLLVPIFLALILLSPAASLSQPWNTIKSQIVPENVAERPPEVSYSEEFERDVFTRQNFYNKSAGTRQYRRSMMAPTKSMEFEVVNPLEQNAEAEDEGPTPSTQVIEKDGKAVTVISIGEGNESNE